MRNIPLILIFVAGIGLAMVSCEKNNTPLSSTVTIPSSSVVVPYTGGTFSVRYGIGNAKDDGYMMASTEDDWISDFDFSVEDTVRFYVAEHYEKAPRYGSVKLLYMLDADTLATNTIQVSQEYNSNYVFDATYACGQYYGMTNYFNSIGAGQYSVYFSDVPMNEYGTFEEGATYYFLDLWHNAEVDGIDFVSLPAASYYFGDVGGNGVLSNASKFFIMSTGEDEDNDEEYSDSGAFVDGYVVVRNVDGETVLTASFDDEWGGTHSLSFTGEFSLENLGLYSTLDGDEAFGDISDVDCEARYYGDYYQTGTANWVLCITPETGTGFVLDICADVSYDMDSGLPVGTFTVSSNWEAGTFVTGTVFNGYLNGSWLASFDEDGSLTAPYAPLADGTIEISASGDSYTVTIDGIDDRLNNITATWSGTPSIIDYRTSTTAAKSEKHHCLIPF